jgi:hypothetical protein
MKLHALFAPLMQVHPGELCPMPDFIAFALPIFFLFAALLLGGSLLAYQFMTGVPPMPLRSDEAADVIALLKQSGLPRGAVIYDLGSGWGSLVIGLANAFPDAQIRGIELSPLPYWIARLRTRGMRNVSLRRGDFFNCELGDADAVACYLMIKPMPRLAALLDHALPDGTPVVAITFSFRNRHAIATLQGRGLRGKVSLYSWPAL